jgi:hypothetical protein
MFTAYCPKYTYPNSDIERFVPILDYEARHGEFKSKGYGP